MTEHAYKFLFLCHDLQETDMKLPKKFIVMSIIEKFPKTLEDFGLDFKHKKGNLTFDDLMIGIAIEEEHRSQKLVMPVKSNARINVTVGNKPSKDQKENQKQKLKQRLRSRKNHEQTLLELWLG